jgi:hypothetical protein
MNLKTYKGHEDVWKMQSCFGGSKWGLEMQSHIQKAREKKFKQMA